MVCVGERLPAEFNTFIILNVRWVSLTLHCQKKKFFDTSFVLVLVLYSISLITKNLNFHFLILVKKINL